MAASPQRLEVRDLDLVPWPFDEAGGGSRVRSALQKVSQAGAELLQVARTGVWVWNGDRSALRRIHLYNRSTGHHGSGGRLDRNRFPTYLEELEEAGGSLVVGDAYGDRRTRELANPYARPKGIRAWLDVPLPVDDEFAGVLRFEHIGPPREWTEEEEEVARALGVLAGTAISRLSDRPPSAVGELGGGSGERLVDLLPAGVVLADASGLIVRCNESYAEMVGYESPSDLVGEPIDRMYASEHLRRGLESQLRRDGSITCRGYDARTRDGESRWFLENAVLLRSTAGSPPDDEYVLSVLVDATGLKERESQLEEQAYRDPLTELPNRRFLWESAEQTLALADRHGREVAVAYLDLSGFKAVNDRYGHDVGDRVLEAASQRLVEGVRDSDLVARMGGDEFAILFAEIEGEEGVLEVGRRMLEVLGRPLRVDGYEIPLGADVGIAIFPRHGSDANTLLKRADQAMYEAKGLEDSDLRLYEEAAGAPERPPAGERDERRPAAGTRRGERPAGEAEPPAGEADEKAPPEALEAGLREALDSGRLTLHYQPVYRLPEYDLIGAEGLLRWDHPERGLLSAADFMPSVRDPDLVRTLDQWAVGTAVAQLRRWEAEGFPPWISVNVDPSSLDMMAFDLQALLGQEGVDPGKLVLEVVSDAPATIEEHAETLAYLRRTGCRIALDLDAGAGEAEDYLAAFPADFLKMDTAYLEGVSGRESDGAAGRGAAPLAGERAEETEVLVKRVETEGQYRRARESSVGLAQGFYCGRPAPPGRLQSA